MMAIAYGIVDSFSECAQAGVRRDFVLVCGLNFGESEGLPVSASVGERVVVSRSALSAALTQRAAGLGGPA